MRIRLLVCTLVAAAICGSGAMAVTNNLLASATPKTIKEVMKIAHKDGLMKKVQGGSSSDEEKKQLLDLYLDMLEGEPKKGDKAEWKIAAGAVVATLQKLSSGVKVPQMN